MNIQHNPITNTKITANYYSVLDGTPVKYICTTELPKVDNRPVDIFYRNTPHPEFGNRYFGILFNDDKMFITNADDIEFLTFSMMVLPEGTFYSRYRHDYLTVGDFFIDGGRAYTRTNCQNIVNYRIYDGEFVIDQHTK